MVYHSTTTTMALNIFALFESLPLLDKYVSSSTKLCIGCATASTFHLKIFTRLCYYELLYGRCTTVAHKSFNGAPVTLHL